MTTTVAAIRDIANLIEAPEETARDGGHPAARPTDEATEEIMTVGAVSAMSQTMSGEDADILPTESLHTVVTVTEILTKERRSLLADDVTTRDPARRTRSRAPQYDQKRPYLRSRMHIPRLK